MTAKRDLKRRVRERQLRTGESYLTARRQVLADRPPSTPAPILVVETIDATPLGARLGFTCRTVVFPALAARVAPARLVGELDRILRDVGSDPALARMRAVVLHGERPRMAHLPRELDETLAFVRRARAGVGGVSAGGRFLAIAVDGHQVLYRLALTPDFALVVREPTLIIGGLERTDLELTGVMDALVP